MIGIIDIGSNSVRLALMADGKTLYKRLKTTRLGEGLSLTGKLGVAAIERTAQAVAEFEHQAESEGAQKVYAFATAAARSAVNGAQFVEYTSEKYGIDIDVVSGEAEGKLALLGALKNKDGGIMDLGGASCEVTVQKRGKIIYTKSVDVGAVRLLDVCGRDKNKLENYIYNKLPEYGDFDASKYDMYGVSGTATTLAALVHGLKQYDPKIVHGTSLTIEKVGQLADILLSKTVDEIRAMGDVVIWRADVIGGASLFLYELMRKMNIQKLTVSENDNLEGYAIYRGLK